MKVNIRAEIFEKIFNFTDFPEIIFENFKKRVIIDDHHIKEYWNVTLSRHKRCFQKQISIHKIFISILIQ